MCALEAQRDPLEIRRGPAPGFPTRCHTHTSWNYRFGVNKVNRSVCVQMLGRDDRSDFWFVLQDSSMYPRVPGVSLDAFQGPRFSHQLPISADFKVTIHEVSIRAVFG